MKNTTQDLMYVLFFDTSIKPADLRSDFSDDGTFLTASNIAL